MENVLFGKHLSELTRADIERIVTEQVQESSEVELKETLPAKKGQDSWLKGEKRIGDYARNEIVAEVIAFANAYGGTLVVGVKETSDKPARAASILPIPSCAELAERLRLQCRDCIEPQIPLLEVAGVPTEKKGVGVIVFRVPRSRVAPHRHTATKECYVRRADRTERMTMREIQDLTLQVERGMAAIETTFEARREKFIERFNAFKGDNGHAFGLRATLLPLVPLHIERVHNNEAVRPPLHSFWGAFGDDEQYELLVPVYSANWGPILRGTRGAGGEDDFSVVRELYCHGLIEYVMLVRKEGEHQLRFYPSWLMALVGNALCAAERFRRVAGAPDVEYGLEFEITNSGAALPVAKYGRGSDFGRWLGPFGEGRTIFPRYSIGPPDEFQLISSVLERDFWHAAGHDWEALIQIDFDRAFKELGIGTEG